MATYEDYQNNRFFKLGGKLWNIIVLSGLFVLCCLPVVTIGASLAALYYGVSKCFGKGSDRPANEFWHSFRDNLGQGSLLTLIYLVFCGLTAFDIIASFKGISGLTLPEGYRMFALLLVLPVVFSVFYIFPYISRYSAGTGLALRNSFLLSASNIGHLLVLILITAAALAGSVFFPPAALVLPGLGALLSSKLIEEDFAKAEQLAGMIPSDNDSPKEESDETTDDIPSDEQ